MRVVSDPPEKWKEDLVFRGTFLVTWGRAYCIKNVMVVFYIMDLSFLIA